MDPDEKVAFLLELFPDFDIEFIFDTLLKNNCDLDETIKSLLDSPDDFIEKQTPFDYLIKTFPDVEIEAIEAFLLTQDGADENDLSKLESDFMKQFSGSVGLQHKPRDRDRDLKMKLSDFSALLKTSRDLEKDKHMTYSGKFVLTQYFSFKFLDDGDEREWIDCKQFSGAEVRQMAIDLQAERINNFGRAAKTFKSGNMTGRSTASYYSDQGHSLAPKIARFHRIAAEKLFMERNPNFKTAKCIDLHNLTTTEALSVSSSFIEHHEALKSTGSIQLITGRGNHSTDGTCKLSTAIWNLLRVKSLNYSFDGIATFTINFKS